MKSAPSDLSSAVSSSDGRRVSAREAAVASIDVVGHAPEELLATLRDLPHVLSVSEVTIPDAERRP